MRNVIKGWIDDVADTGNRIGRDVAHLREIARQATAAAKIATGAAKAKLERLADDAATKIAKFEAATGAQRNSRNRNGDR